MKKLFSRVISIFAVFALISCGLISCSDIENNESGSVSFSISPDLAKAVLDTGRSLRAETDPTGDPSANESPSPYRIEVSLSGGRAETKRHSYTESEWQAIAEKSESVKGKENVTSFTFDNIPVGTQIAISATIFLASDGLDYPCMAGKSAVVEIQQGDNPVSFNVHRLAMFNLECSSDEEITGISKLNVYALDSDSKKASSLLEILKSADSSSESDAELFEKLEAEKSIYSYDKPKSPNLTGGFELKKGSTVNFFTLLYTEKGVYLGYDSQMASTTVNTSDIASLSLTLKKLDLTYTYIFPAKYENKTISAWYVGENTDENADYNGEVAVTKTEYSATFLFSDGTFVVTSHSKKVDSSGTIWKEKIHYVMRGNYELEDSGTFEDGTLTLTPSAMYEANDNSSKQGWIELTEAQSVAAKLSCKVSSGSFTPPSDQMEEPYPFYKKAENAYLRVYRGEIDDSLAPSSGDEPDPSVDYSKVCFFPTGYENKTVAAWYASEDVTTDKSKFFALYLFSDGDFVATKRTITTSGEERKIEMSGEYSLQTPDEYKNNTGSAQAKVDDGTGEYSITIKDGLFSVKNVDTTWLLQSGSVPTAQSETSEDTPHHSAMDFEITLTNSSVPSAELYQVSIFAINESGYSNMSKIGSLSEQEKASVLVETLMDESVGKYLGSYTPTVQNWYDSDGSMLETPETIANPMMTVSEDGATITISDSYTSYGAMQANATTAIVALVQYGSDSTDFKAFTVGVSKSFTTSTSSTNTVSMNMDSMAVPVKVNFFVGENPNLLSSTVIVSDTWVANLETIAADSSILSDKLAVFIRENGYENATIPTSGSYFYNGIPCFGVQVEKTGNTYTGTCEKGGTTYNITLSVYEKDSSSGIYSVINDVNSLLISAGTYTVSKNVVTVLETDYRSDYSSSFATLYGAYGAAEQSFNTTDSTFSLTSGSSDSDKVTFTFGNSGDSDFTNLAFFPSDYADKTVSAWYASEEVSTDKTKIYALYLFGDNTFVATKREIQDSGETREIDQQGQYTFEGKADFENGEGTASITEGGESKEYSFSIVDGLFSIAGVDTTYELQNGDLPEPSSVTTPSIQVIIKFLFENESGQYVEREDFQSITAGSDYQATIPDYTARAYLLGYIMSTKTESKPTYDSEANAYVLDIYYDLNSPESVTLDGGITVKLDSLSSEDLGEKISLSVEKAEDGKSVKITASPDASITVSQYKLILFEGQEQLSPEGTLDSSTGSYVWTLTENIINNLSAGNHQITVSVIIADKLYTASTNLTITK